MGGVGPGGVDRREGGREMGRRGCEGTNGSPVCYPAPTWHLAWGMGASDPWTLEKSKKPSLLQFLRGGAVGRVGL